jgi:helicase-like protein/SNF2 domain-containing protein
MLVLKFRQSDQRAVILSVGEDRAFRDLRLELGRASQSLTNEGPSQFTLDWWEFLPLRGRLSSIRARHGTTISIDDSAREALQITRDREESERERLVAAPVPPADLEERLRASGFVRRLEPYQLRNVLKMSRSSVAADFSVPGAGKTSEALAFYALKRSPRSRLLVICPKNAFAAWEEQLGLCLGEQERFVRLTGGRQNIQTILAGEPKRMLVGFMQFAGVQDIFSTYMSGQESFVFVDESHHMKRGNEGFIGDAILRLSPVPRSKLVMSGTPMPQSIRDLVYQVRFLTPGSQVDEDNVIAAVDALSVRTTKQDLRLPPVRRELVRVEMGTAQADLYRLASSEIARQAKSMLTSLDKSALRKFNRSVVRLLQIASNPALLGTGTDLPSDVVRRAIEDGDSRKITAACNRARELAAEGSKVIIWSTFVRNVELLSARLADLGADFIHGGVEAGSEEEEATREAKVKRFKLDPSAKVLVANPAACSEGISLHTVCHHSIYLDRNFNAAQYLQSEERIHRIGLPADQLTFHEILQSPGTIDEVVHHRLVAKVDRMARVLSDPSLTIDSVLDLEPDDDTVDREDAVEVLAQIVSKG